ncbi:MAG TPA: ABC transporter substrate-binding protein [Methylomirabilota bacterium]|nr:ABC transporter substrate-binding protein [Methylomirabilota bacterium]
METIVDPSESAPRPQTPRRRFLVRAGGALTAAAAGAVVAAPAVIAQPKVKWRLSTAYPASLDTLHGAAERLAAIVNEMSGGRFVIEVYPGGQLMPPFEVFDATSQGRIEAFMSVPYYFTERKKESAFEWFTTVPFGMNPQGMAAWYHYGDGFKLLEESYAAFNLVPKPGPAFAPQMGGWFRKKINSLADYKGLRMRIGGLGGRIIGRAGATAILTPAAEIFGALERGVIDAGEWVAPHDDMKLGLHNTAPYYYYPGWHEPGTMQGFGFNRKAYEALPAELRQTLAHAAAATEVYGISGYHQKNAVALARMRTEFKGKIELIQFPAPVLRELKKIAVDVLREESEKTPMAKKVYASFTKFQELVGPWDTVTEGAAHQHVIR